MAANSVMVPHSEAFGYVKVVDFRLEWPVTCDERQLRRDWSVTSPIFSPGFNNELKWRMKFYSNSNNLDHRDAAALYLFFVPSTKNAEFRGKFTFSIFNSNGTQLNTEVSETHTFVAGTNAAKCGFDNVMRRSALRGSDGSTTIGNITIVCEIKGLSSISDVPGKNDAAPFVIPQYRFPDNLRALFESKRFSDVTLTVCGETIGAHKVVLAMYSDVFAAMFEHEMTERTSNEIKITDVTPAVCNEMLRYMYTGEVNGIEKIADFLLVAADKYNLGGLKAMCEEALCENIVVENAADILILADKHNANQLKPRVLRFIAAFTKNVMATSGFEAMVKSNPHLVVEILRELALRKNDELLESTPPEVDKDIVADAALDEAKV